MSNDSDFLFLLFFLFILYLKHRKYSINTTQPLLRYLNPNITMWIFKVISLGLNFHPTCLPCINRRFRISVYTISSLLKYWITLIVKTSICKVSRSYGVFCFAVTVCTHEGYNVYKNKLMSSKQVLHIEIIFYF